MCIQEHSLLPEEFNPESWNDKIKNGFCLNPSAVDFEKRFFCVWDTKRAGYYSTYVIGAQYIEGKPLIVTTKKGCDKIDFLKIFNTCFFSGLESESFNKIYNLDFIKPRIKTKTFSGVLSPLIVVHYLSVVKRIITKGLKNDYINCNENLKKVKGKICIYQNDRTNIQRKRLDRVYCSYQDYSTNTPENRLLKRALIFSKKVLQQMGSSKQTAVELINKTNVFLQAFENVDDNIEIREVYSIKNNKLYSDYNDAIGLAKTILHRFDYSITQVDLLWNEVPPFWMDMSLLYEHYVLGLLKDAYHDKIIYQFKGNTGQPDFLYKPNDSNEIGIILDTKYIPKFNKEKIDVDIVRQLSGYARDSKVIEALGAKHDSVIPCVVIYPVEGKEENPFKNNSIDSFLRSSESGLNEFYKIQVPLPEYKP